jgi:hypothetical protein
MINTSCGDIGVVRAFVLVGLSANGSKSVAPAVQHCPDPLREDLSAASAHLGAGRLLNPISYTTLPPRSGDEARANSSTANHLASFVEEFLAFAGTSMQQASSLTTLNGKPLIVLTADEGINDPHWQAKQDHLATLSTDSLHRHANATHESLIDDPADSAAASQAIDDVVAAVRSSQPLTSR